MIGTLPFCAYLQEESGFAGHDQTRDAVLRNRWSGGNGHNRVV